MHVQMSTYVRNNYVFRLIKKKRNKNKTDFTFEDFLSTRDGMPRFAIVAANSFSWIMIVILSVLFGICL